MTLIPILTTTLIPFPNPDLLISRRSHVYGHDHDHIDGTIEPSSLMHPTRRSPGLPPVGASRLQVLRGLMTNPPAAVAGSHGEGAASGRAVSFVESSTVGQGEWASCEPPPLEGADKPGAHHGGDSRWAFSQGGSAPENARLMTAPPVSIAERHGAHRSTQWEPRKRSRRSSPCYGICAPSLSGAGRPKSSLYGICAVSLSGGGGTEG